MNAHGEESLAEFLDLDALFGRHERHVVHLDMDHDDALVKDLVVLEVMQQRARNRINARGQEHRGARHAHGCLLGAFQEQA